MNYPSLDHNLKTNNHPIKYNNDSYGDIIIFFEIENDIYCVVEKFREIEKKKFILNLNKKSVSDTLHENFYDIFKFMNKNETLIEIINLNDINNKCVSCDLNDFLFITECVNYDNFD